MPSACPIMLRANCIIGFSNCIMQFADSLMKDLCKSDRRLLNTI